MHTRGERFDVALGLRVINYVWRHRVLERACARGIHVYVGCVCERARMIEIKKEDISHKINDMGEMDRYENMHACESAGKKAQ